MLWDVSQPSSPLTCFNLPGGVYNVSVSSEGRIFATGPDDKTAKVWNIGNSETPIITFTLPDEERSLSDQQWQVSKAAFAHKSNKLACVDIKGMLYVWDVYQQHRKTIDSTNWQNAFV